MADMLYANGLRQDAFATLLALINTKFTATLTLLDADTGIAATDYVSGSGITFPSTEINANGIWQGSLMTFLNSFLTSFNAVLAKLDADGLDESDYVSTLTITDTIADGGSEAGMSPMGMGQKELTDMVDLMITNFNLLNVKIDACTTAQTDTYNSANAVTDTLDTTV